MPISVTHRGRFPLSNALPGQSLRIATHPADKGLCRRLRDLGLPVGAELKVIQGTGRGRMVVARDHLRLALDARVSGAILVEPAESPRSSLVPATLRAVGIEPA